MKIISFFILFILVSCSSSFNQMNLNPIEKLMKIYREKLSKDEIVNLLNASKQRSQKRLRVSLSGKEPDTLIYFDTNNIVEEIIFYNSTSSIDRAIQNIKCMWSLKEDYQSFNGHNYKLIKKGKCLDHNISFKYISKNDQYEIRWKVK